MYRTLAVAIREFLSTVLTKGFVIGVVLVPAIISVGVVLTPLLLSRDGPAVQGSIAVIDRSGQVADRIVKAFSPEAAEAARAAAIERTQAGAAEAMRASGVADPASPAGQAAGRMAAAAMAPKPPRLSVEVLPPDADPTAASASIVSSDKPAADSRLAVVTIERATVAGNADGTYPGYAMLVAPRLDFEVQRNIRAVIGRAVIDARIEAGGLGDQRQRIRAMVSMPDADTKAVTAEGVKAAGGEGAGILLPMAFMLLLWVSVFTAGQYLLTTTIEEKSSRVMEVLLSAVSPMQLMTGKIVGQMAVGLLILLVYAGLGVGLLISRDLTHLIDWGNVVYLIAYFLIAFFLIASMMAAIGSAVSDMREAQTLMAPVMMVLMLPMLLWMPIQRNPNSTFATVLSFVPPVGPFAMVLRIAGSEPVPAWQVPASIAVGVFWAFVFAWAAAKIFRIGVLMYGKPPNFATLVRWIRMA